MAKSVADRLREIDSLAESIRHSVSCIRSLDGACNPFSSLAENSNIHDSLKRMTVEAAALTRHFGSQLRRQNAKAKK